MNLKKHISILLTFFLLVSNLGLAFNVHYCGGKVASVTLHVPTAEGSEKNCCGAVEQESKCCKNKIIKSEIKSEQLIVKSLTFAADYIPVYNDWKPIVFTSNFTFKKTEITPYYCDANAPPFYLLYSQYTFYS